MYRECWFTGKFYFKHGGSQNATLTHRRHSDVLHTSNHKSIRAFASPIFNMLIHIGLSVVHVGLTDC